jgi:hypothetical protein
VRRVNLKDAWSDTEVIAYWKWRLEEVVAPLLNVPGICSVKLYSGAGGSVPTCAPLPSACSHVEAPWRNSTPSRERPVEAVGAAARRISAGTTRRQLPAVFPQMNAIDLNRVEMIMTQHGRRWGCASLFVLVGWLLVSLLSLLGVPACAAEPLVLYDDFNAALIDPNRWSLAAGWEGA